MNHRLTSANMPSLDSGQVILKVIYMIRRKHNRRDTVQYMRK